MKKLLILLAVLTLPLAALAKNKRGKASDDHPYDDITIISDLDDTIKITNVGVSNPRYLDRFSPT